MGTRRNYRKREDTHEDPNPLRVLPVAENLVDYTLDLTDNVKRFPKKVRFTIVNRVQDCVLTVYTNILDANEIYPIRTEQDRVDRLNLQRDALTACKKLLFFVKLAKKRHYIDEGTFDTWTNKVLDVKVMVAAWYNAEQAAEGEADTAAPEVAEPAGQAGG